MFKEMVSPSNRLFVAVAELDVALARLDLFLLGLHKGVDRGLGHVCLDLHNPVVLLVLAVARDEIALVATLDDLSVGIGLGGLHRDLDIVVGRVEQLEAVLELFVHCARVIQAAHLQVFERDDAAGCCVLCIYFALLLQKAENRKPLRQGP